MASSLFALLDDIATILDDVLVMTKIAAKKTAGVLGDDLALNAEQVTGVVADRELPVVWAVAKGSFLNKLVLVPLALLLSLVLPWVVVPLLMAGGAFLCFEGFEKIAHKLLHSKDQDDARHKELVKAVLDQKVDLVALEKDKIKAAIRTDFVLSAEIIVISLGVVRDVPFVQKIGVLAGIAVIMTVGVYGLVAAIVKLDDLGLHLAKKSGGSAVVGRAILVSAPYLMKGLSIVGTAAMFLVGGGIISHNVGWIHHLAEGLTHSIGGVIGSLVSSLLDAIIGIAVGGLIVGVAAIAAKLRPTQAAR